MTRPPRLSHPSRCGAVADYVDLFQTLANASFDATGSLVFFGRFPQFLGDSENEYFRDYLSSRNEIQASDPPSNLRRRRYRIRRRSHVLVVRIQNLALRVIGAREMQARAQKVPAGAIIAKPHVPGRILRASLFPGEYSLARSPSEGREELLLSSRGHLVQLPTCRNWVFLLHNLITLAACLWIPRNKNAIIVDAFARSSIPRSRDLDRANQEVRRAALSSVSHPGDANFVESALKNIGPGMIACDILLQSAYNRLFGEFLHDVTVFQTNAINKEDRVMTYFGHMYGHKVVFRTSRVITRYRSSVLVRPHMRSEFLPDRYEVADRFSASELASMGVTSTIIGPAENYGRSFPCRSLGVALQAQDDGAKDVLSFALDLATSIGADSLTVQPHPHFGLHGVRLWLRWHARKRGISIRVGDATEQAAIVLTAYSSEGLRAHDAGRLALWVPELAERSWVMAPIMDQVGHRVTSIEEAVSIIEHWGERRKGEPRIQHPSCEPSS